MGSGAVEWVRVTDQEAEQGRENDSVASLLTSPGASSGSAAFRATLVDLNLDQVLSTIVGGRSDTPLHDLLSRVLTDVDQVLWRQDVFRDLEDEDLQEALRRFRDNMAAVRLALQRERRASDWFRWHARRWHVEAIDGYCDATTRLSVALTRANLRSVALQLVREQLGGYVDSPGFRTMTQQTARVLADLADVRFGMRLRTDRVTVVPPIGGRDFPAEVEELFDRFRMEGDTSSAGVDPVKDPGTTHVEAQVVNLVARLHPEPFRALAEHCLEHQDFIDERVRRWDEELRFFLSYLDFINPLTRVGMPFCYPEVRAGGAEVCLTDSFDLALAAKSTSTGGEVVCNDAELTGPERVLVVTGPNQGGKTTFARMVGQVHHLAAIGVPVPGRRVTVPLVDAVLTHFEQAEDLSDPSGKLESDLRRLKSLLERATPRSLVVINEIFTSTSLTDALELGRRVLTNLVERRITTVYVTFLDALSELGPATVSMLAEVDPRDPTVRTFKVTRRPANGTAHALALASRYGLRYAQLTERIQT